MNRNSSVHINTMVLCAVLFVGSSCTCHPSAPSTQQDKLVIFAAASLRDAFNTMAEQFKHTHPEVELTFNFAGTQALRTQIEYGASADIFASADLRQMDMLAQEGYVLSPIVFTQNKLVVVLAKKLFPHIQSFSDLPSVSRIVVGSPEVPIGQYTLQILSSMPGLKTRIEAKVVSREFNAKQILSKVRLGEAQAGFVYQSDALTAPELAIVDIPDDINLMAQYPITILSSAKNPQLARKWIDFVLSDTGQRILRDAGFMPLATGH